MNLAKKALLALLISVGLFGAGFWYSNYSHPQVAKSFGSFTPVQCNQAVLSGAGITSNQTTIQLTSFTSQGNQPLTMANFGAIGYVVIDPNSPNKVENATFTGITQNNNGTAILTGVTRGLDFVYPYLASTTLQKQHSGGAYIICSNPAPFYQQQFLLANNNSTSTALLKFSSTTPPSYDGEPIWGNFSAEVLATVAYVNSVVAAGAANASETVKGIVQLATAAQLALGTSLGSTAARLGIPNSLATSTPTAACTSGCVPVAVNGKLAQAFLDLTQAFTYSTTTQYIANIGKLTATTSATLPQTVTFGSLGLTFPVSQGAANTTLINNGSGVLSWAIPISLHYSFASTTASALGASGGTLTSKPINIAANTLSASSTITVTGHFSCTDGGSGGGCDVKLIDTNGTTYIDAPITPGTSHVCSMPFTIIATGVGGSSSAQFTMFSGGCNISTTFGDKSTSNASSANWTLATGIELQFVSAAFTSASASLDGYIVTVTP